MWYVKCFWFITVRWRSLLKHCATSRKVESSMPDCVFGIFLLASSFRPRIGPGVDSTSNRNEYQVCFLRVKAAGVYGWQPYRLHVPIVLKSVSLSLVEPSGLVQACNEIDVPLLYRHSELRNGVKRTFFNDIAGVHLLTHIFKSFGVFNL